MGNKENRPQIQRRPSIQEWESVERPREKFLMKGAGALSNAELLAILIGSGYAGENAVELSRRILRSSGNSLSALRKLDFENFRKFKGIGPGKALSIMAAFELARRMESEPAERQAQIYSSEHAAKAIAPFLRDLGHEECWVLYLNRSNHLIGKERISSGGVSATVIDSRMILKGAMNRLASGIILVHNHPSGNAFPGNEDRIQTQRLKKSAEICEVELIDHIIVAGTGYFSFLDEGLL